MSNLGQRAEAEAPKHRPAIINGTVEHQCAPNKISKKQLCGRINSFTVKYFCYQIRKIIYMYLKVIFYMKK